MPYQNPFLPQTTAPLGYSMTQPYTYGLQQQPIHGFVYVTGMEGARAYQMPPNSEMPLFDSTNDGVMFIKTTDAAGFPTIEVVDCTKRGQAPRETDPVYVERGEFDSAYRELSDSIEQLKGAIYARIPETAAAAEPNAEPKAADSRRSRRNGAADAKDQPAVR
jgi:hypothetical protein